MRFKKRDPKEVGIAIEAYIKQITTCTEPLAIYLFGSLARGEGSIESDIDLLIIYSHQAEARAAQKTILREPSPYPIPADLICIDRDSWDGIHRYSHLVDLVKEEGKLVFASSDWLAERSGLNESPKERIYKKEYAYELMRIAGSDLAAGQAIFDARAGRSENVAYFAEQVAEKCIKAVLCYRSIAFPAIHDLRQLLTYLPEIQAPPHSKELQELTIFGTVRRYEEGPWMLTWEESEIALDAAKNVFKWAQDIVKPV